MKNREQNTKVYRELLLSMDVSKESGKVAFDIILESHFLDLPNGDATLAWKCLGE